MRKFIVRYLKSQPTILEVECEQIHDPSLAADRWKAKILAPSHLLEKQKDPITKQEVLVSPVYYDFAFHETAENAMEEVRENWRLEGLVSGKLVEEVEVKVSYL